MTNVIDVWECDLLDVQTYAKYSDNHRYILSGIDVFSKFLHTIAIEKKSGLSVSPAFRSLFDDTKYSSQRRRPICVRTDKGKESLNKHFQVMLDDEGSIQYHTCRNIDLKCALLELLHRTIRDRLYKYFIHKYT